MEYYYNSLLVFYHIFQCIEIQTGCLRGAIAVLDATTVKIMNFI